MALGQAWPRSARRSYPPALARRAPLPVRRHPDRLSRVPGPRLDGLSLRPRHANLLHRQDQRRPDRGDGLRPGGGLLDWQTVQPKVATFARVCSYDRSGTGWSESGRGPRTSQRIVKELHALLSDAGEEAPYVLVGHSFGGANVQLYASEYPEEVAGMVLVDSALDTRVLDKDLRDAFAKAAPPPLTLKTMAPLGIPRLLASGEDSLPKRLAQERGAIYNGTRHLYAVADESATVQESVAQATDAVPSLGEKPLVALSAGARQYPGFTKKQAKRADEQANEFEAGLINLSENSELVVAKNSEHYIQFDRPVLVVDSIRRVVDAARDGGRV